MKTDSLKNVLESQVMSPQEKFTILVVDDEPVNVLLLEETLASSGYEAVGAKNGPQARQLAREQLPDLILLDIMMPGESGFEVIQKLKKDARTSHIPVIFLTAASDVEKKLEGFRLGAVDYIVKPFHPEEVNARIKLHLKLNRAQQMLISCTSSQLKESPQLSTELINPTDLPEANFDLYQELVQGKGGDFFDVQQLSEQIFSFFVADISSHDDNKEFLCASMHQLLQQNASPIYTPLDTMTMLNGVLGEIMAGSDAHLTGCLAHLNRDTRQISVSNSAHPPILCIPKQGQPFFLECRGDVMGIFPEVCFELRCQPLEQGDRLVIYTDGLVQRASCQQVWTEELWRLQEAASVLRDTPLQGSAELFVNTLSNPNCRKDTDLVVMVIDV